MKMLILLFCVLLVACGTNPTPMGSKTVIAEVSVPVDCKIAKVPKPDSLVDNLRSEDDIHTKIKTILAEMESKEAYEKELEAALKECQ